MYAPMPDCNHVCAYIYIYILYSDTYIVYSLVCEDLRNMSAKSAEHWFLKGGQGGGRSVLGDVWLELRLCESQYSILDSRHQLGSMYVRIFIYIQIHTYMRILSLKLLGRAGGSCPEVAAVSTYRRPALPRCVLNTACTSTASKTPKPQPSTKLNSRRPGVRGPTVFLGVKTMRDIHACFCFQALSANASSKACISRSLPDLGATPRLS